MSIDVHKLGYAPKGSSVIVHASKELRRYQTFVFDGWLGGLYASPNIQGSRSGLPMATAWAVMHHLGIDGYRDSPGRRSTRPAASSPASRDTPGSRCWANPTRTSSPSRPTPGVEPDRRVHARRRDGEEGLAPRSPDATRFVARDGQRGERAERRRVPRRPRGLRRRARAARTDDRSTDLRDAGVTQSSALSAVEAVDGFDVLLDELAHHVARRAAPGSSCRRPGRRACRSSSRSLRAADAVERVGHEHELHAASGGSPGESGRSHASVHSVRSWRAGLPLSARERTVCDDVGLEHLLDDQRRHVALGDRQPDRTRPRALRAHRERRRDLRAVRDPARREHRRVGAIASITCGHSTIELISPVWPPASVPCATMMSTPMFDVLLRVRGLLASAATLMPCSCAVSTMSLGGGPSALTSSAASAATRSRAAGARSRRSSRAGGGRARRRRAAAARRARRAPSRPSRGAPGVIISSSCALEVVGVDAFRAAATFAGMTRSTP